MECLTSEKVCNFGGRTSLLIDQIIILMYCCPHKPTTDLTKPSHKNISTLMISYYFCKVGCMLCGGQNSEFLIYDSCLHETGVILRDNWFCKKEWLGINYHKNINNRRPHNSIQDINSFSVLEAYFTSSLSQRINDYIKLLKLRDFYEYFTEILMA